MIVGESQRSECISGLMLFAGGVFFMSAMDVAAKLLVSRYSEIQVIFFESVFGLLFFFTIIAPKKLRSLISPRWPLMLARGLLTLGAVYFFVSGLKTLSLAEVTIVFMVGPIITMGLSSLFFQEHAGIPQIIATLLGVFGAFFLIYPPGMGVNLATFLPLAAAFCSALSLAAARALSRRDTPEAIAGYEYIALFVVSLLLVPTGHHFPSLTDVLLLVVLGVCGALGVFLRTTACAISPLNLLAPIEYTGMVWAVVFSYLFWNSLPDFWGWLGAILIALGGCLSSWSGGRSTNSTT